MNACGLFRVMLHPCLESMLFFQQESTPFTSTKGERVPTSLTLLLAIGFALGHRVWTNTAEFLFWAQALGGLSCFCSSLLCLCQNHKKYDTVSDGPEDEKRSVLELHRVKVDRVQPRILHPYAVLHPLVVSNPFRHHGLQPARLPSP